jgi:molecular chaperone DnaK (HSP70)
VPVIGADGAPRFGADLMALAAAGLLHHATRGLAPDQLMITYPAAWGRYQTSILHSALTATWLNGIPTGFVSSPVATAEAAEAVGAIRPGETVLAVDVGGRRTDLAVVAGGVGQARRVVVRSDTDELGAVLLDRALAAHIAAHAGPAEPTDLDALRALVDRARRARMELVRQPSTVVDVPLPTGTERVRVVRGEFDALISDSISAGVAAIAHILAEAQGNGAGVTSVLLTGEASRTPLLAERLSTRIRPGALFPADPEWTLPRAAADIAANRARQLRAAAATPVPPQRLAAA